MANSVWLPKPANNGKSMKAKLNLLTAGIFLAALGTGFGQNALQISTNNFLVVEPTNPASLMLHPAGDTNAEVSVDFAANELTATNGPSGPQLGGAGNVWTVSRFQGAALGICRT